jgi:hypothetical protein
VIVIPFRNGFQPLFLQGKPASTSNIPPAVRRRHLPGNALEIKKPERKKSRGGYQNAGKEKIGPMMIFLSEYFLQKHGFGHSSTTHF